MAHYSLENTLSSVSKLLQELPEGHWQDTCYTNKKLIRLYHLENEQLQDNTPRITPQVKLQLLWYLSLALYPSGSLKLRNMAPKECNYTSSRLHIMLEDSSMLHELFFVSKVPCLSIILSFRIKRMLSIEEHRTMLINFYVQTQGISLQISPQGSNFPHLTTILGRHFNLSVNDFFPPNHSLFILLISTRAIKEIMMLSIISHSQKGRATIPICL